MTMKKIYSEPTLEIVKLEMMQILAASDDVFIDDPDIEDVIYGGTDTEGILDPS